MSPAPAHVMKVLTFSTLYPNAAMPNHGVFVENRLRAYRDHSGTEVRVVAPVPWFPFEHKLFGAYGKWAAAPHQETRHGIDVSHPRYAIPPKMGMTYAPQALERCLLKEAIKLQQSEWDFDLIDAHYLYPDGIAAVRVARKLGKPVVLTARGSDVSLIPNYPRQRTMILDAIYRADAVICVAEALKDRLEQLGAPSQKIDVFRNGVDLNLFQPMDRSACRKELNIQTDRCIASVGHLIDRKGHDLVIDALQTIPNTTLLIVGDGPEREKLVSQAASTSLKDRIRFLGAIPHDQLKKIYSAADVLVLASTREGWPNVLLEAMACGTPAVAAPIWGCGEVINSPEAGALAQDRTPQRFSQAINALLHEPPIRSQTRAYAEQFSWRDTAENLDTLFRNVKRSADTRNRVAYSLPNSALLDDTPKLIVTVDTEDAFDWKNLDDPGMRICPPEDVIPFQQICDDVGVKPSYFITQSLLQDDETAAFFRDLHRQGKADLGLHLHQWVTPQGGTYSGEFYSFQMNLPNSSHEEKLADLVNSFKNAIGFEARTHRAGRYGVSPDLYESFARYGIEYDFSPSPAYDQSASGGPNFSAMSNHPFAVDTSAGRVWVTPVSGAHAIRRTNHFLAQNKEPPGFRYPLKAPPPFTAPMRLTCEGADLKSLKSLTKRLIQDETPVLTFSLHSTTLTPGANAYAADRDKVDHALRLTRAYFDYFVNEVGGQLISVSKLSALYESR